MGRIDRERLSDSGDSLGMLGDEPPDDTSGLVVKIFNGGSIPTVGNSVFLGNPVELDFDEHEGASHSESVDVSTIIPVFVVGTNIPAVGDILVAKAVAGRWVARKGTPHGGGFVVTVGYLWRGGVCCKPVEGATVTVYQSDGTTVFDTQTTDSSGQATVNVPDPFYFAIRATKAGFTDCSQDGCGRWAWNHQGYGDFYASHCLILIPESMNLIDSNGTHSAVGTIGPNFDFTYGTFLGHFATYSIGYAVSAPTWTMCGVNLPYTDPLLYHGDYDNIVVSASYYPRRSDPGIFSSSGGQQLGSALLDSIIPEHYLGRLRVGTYQVGTTGGCQRWVLNANSEDGVSYGASCTSPAAFAQYSGRMTDAAATFPCDASAVVMSGTLHAEYSHPSFGTPVDISYVSGAIRLEYP